jgi:hypothetical protein
VRRRTSWEGEAAVPDIKDVIGVFSTCQDFPRRLFSASNFEAEGELLAALNEACIKLLDEVASVERCRIQVIYT